MSKATTSRSANGDGSKLEPGEHRDLTAEGRDERAKAHDLVSQERDDRAEERDERAEEREQVSGETDSGAAADRAGARRDRRGGASDRMQAADDREAASVDRTLSSQDRAASSLDELTGTHRRDAGTVELRREMARAKRTKQPFVLAFVDVDNLKGTNDSHGHSAGDKLLRDTADAIRTHLREYDLVIRFGGDEFVCGLLDITMEVAASRFDALNADLAESRQASVTVGLAELQEEDALEDLVTRADEAMYLARKNGVERRPRQTVN